YRVAVWNPFGIVGSEFTALGYKARRRLPRSVPTFQIVEASSTTVLVAVHRELRHSESQLCLTAHWTKQTGVQLSIEGVAQRLSLADVRQLWRTADWAEQAGLQLSIEGVAQRLSLADVGRGLEILQSLEAVGGRPSESTRYYSREEFHARYPGAYAEAKKRRGARPRDEDIARALGISESTMRCYLREYGRPALS